MNVVVQTAVFVSYGCFGLLLEIFFTGMHDLLMGRNKNMRAVTSLWMAPIYGIGATCLEILSFAELRLPLFIVIGVIIVYFVEFSLGWVSRRAGLRLWDYQHARFNVKGLIRLDYVFFWVMVVVVFYVSHNLINDLVHFVLKDVI